MPPQIIFICFQRKTSYSHNNRKWITKINLLSMGKIFIVCHGEKKRTRCWAWPLEETEISFVPWIEVQWASFKLRSSYCRIDRQSGSGYSFRNFVKFQCCENRSKVTCSRSKVWVCVTCSACPSLSILFKKLPRNFFACLNTPRLCNRFEMKKFKRQLYKVSYKMLEQLLIWKIILWILQKYSRRFFQCSQK